VASIEQGTASIPSLLQYMKCAESLGVNAVGVATGNGVAVDCLKDNTARLDGQRFQQTLKALILAADDPLFGLKTARFVQPITYSVFGYMAMNSRNLEDVLRRVPKYEKLVGDMGVTAVSDKGNNRFVRWQCHMSDALVRRHVIENVLASWTQFARWITGSEHSPIEIHFEHSPPPQHNQLSEYAALFRCPVLFDQAETGILVAGEHMHLALIQADESVLQSLEETANKRLASITASLSMTERVKGALQTLLQDGIPRKDVVARMVGMTSRTLQRRLQEEGSSYQDILNRLRHDIATGLLENTALSLEEIGHRIGFQGPRSFNRSFKLYTGTTPGDYRRSHKKP